MSKKWWIWSVVGKSPYKTEVLRRRLECFINYLPLLAFVTELYSSAAQENGCQSPSTLLYVAPERLAKRWALN